MPRYFFDIDDGERRSLDEDGLEFASPWEARANAIAVLPDIAREVMPDGDRRDLVSSVRNEGGDVLFTAKLSLVAEWLVPEPAK
jgi:hypothetical protein